MVMAMVLMKVARGQVNEIANIIADMKGAFEVYSLSGQYDLVVLVRGQSNEELADIVTNQLQTARNIVTTETMIMFRAYSRHDMEGIFSIGLNCP